jgi:hypothetical protein
MIVLGFTKLITLFEHDERPPEEDEGQTLWERARLEIQQSDKQGLGLATRKLIGINHPKKHAKSESEIPGVRVTILCYKGQHTLLVTRTPQIEPMTLDPRVAGPSIRGPSKLDLVPPSAHPPQTKALQTVLS